MEANPGNVKKKNPKTKTRKKNRSRFALNPPTTGRDQRKKSRVKRKYKQR